MEQVKVANSERPPYQLLKYFSGSENIITLDTTIQTILQMFPRCEEYVVDFIEACEQAIEIALRNQWNILFTLARRLKGMLESDAWALGPTFFLPCAILLAEFVDQRKIGCLQGPDGTPICFSNWEEIEIWFELAWENVKSSLDKDGKGELMLIAALKYSRHLHSNIFPEGMGPLKCDLLGICYYMHLHIEKVFYLPQDRLATLLERPQTTISACIDYLVRSKHLIRVEKSDYARGKATKYRLHGPNVPKAISIKARRFN